jgi:RimJ/RimL family protein N-acetyltransferase
MKEEVMENHEIYFRPISNDSVIIREFSPTDEEDLYILLSNINVVRYLGLEAMKNRESSLPFIRKIIDDYRKGMIYYLAIENKSDHRMIGYIGLSRYDLTLSTCQVVYALNETYWHRGLMVQALRLFVKYLIETENKEIIIATHIDENINSGRVMLKAGFQKDPDYDRTMVIKGVNRKLVGYSIKKRSYEL